MTNKSTNSEWKKEYAGCYTNGKIRIERSEQFGGWNVYEIRNGVTQSVYDNLPTKKEAMRIYG